MSMLRELFQGELPSLVMFDLDGTLVDSVPDLAAAIDQTLVLLGLPAAGIEQVRDWVGNGARVLVRRALAGDAAPLAHMTLLAKDTGLAMAAMAGQSRRAATARLTYLVTTPLEIPKAVAICWCDCWPSNLRRKASLSLRMLILGAGIAVLKKRIDANPTEI